MSHGRVWNRLSSQSPRKNPTSGATISSVGIASRSPAVRSPFPADSDPPGTFMTRTPYGIRGTAVERPPSHALRGGWAIGPANLGKCGPGVKSENGERHPSVRVESNQELEGAMGLGET